jgi:hypothetical protein
MSEKPDQFCTRRLTKWTPIGGCSADKWQSRIDSEKRKKENMSNQEVLLLSDG